MNAYLVDAYGTNSPWRAGEAPDPVVGDCDVLVEIHASGVNPLDKDDEVVAG